MTAINEKSGRYHRQEIFEKFGQSAQEKFSAGRVAIIGCGGLGSSLAEQLARSGIGFVRLVDGDRVELSNIHRQHLFAQADTGQFKVEVAAEKLSQLNSSVKIEAVADMLTEQNAEKLISGCDFVLDALDNFDARTILNKFCTKLGKPWVFCGVSGCELMTTTIIPRQTGCLYCALDMPQSGKSHPGILPPVVWTASGLAAMEVFKFFSAAGIEALNTKLLCMNLWTGQIRQLNTAGRDENCPVCGEKGY